MIPKIIHYCWFGNGEIPAKDKKCIGSWRRLCPDYEIKIWNESNYDITKNKYMSEAYNEKKWGFVPDYARFDIIYEHGGFYLDTDVELIKSLDILCCHKAYLGFECGNWVNAGIGFGAEKGNGLIKELRDMYKEKHFVNSDGSLNLKPSPHYITIFLESKGLIRKDVKQTIAGAEIYPIEYFAPKDYYTGKIRMTENTISIHKYNASWQSPHRRRMLKIRKLIGNERYNDLVELKNKIVRKDKQEG